MATPNRIRFDSDGAWKEGLGLYPEQSLQLLCPAIYDEIDWTYKPEALDKELYQIVPEAEVGKRYVDKLFKVRHKQGNEVWLYIHIEFQAQKDQDLARRMFVYYILLYLRFKTPILSVAILGDKQSDWRPEKFELSLGGCTASLTYPVIKLWDYRDRIKELKQSGNPFAYFVIAYLKTLETKQNPQQRLDQKKSIIRDLLEQGFHREEIRDLFKLIDSVMRLPQDLEQEFLHTVYEYQEEKKMTFMAPFEQIAMNNGFVKGKEEGKEEGKKEGKKEGSIEEAQAAVLDILSDQFGKLPLGLRGTVKSIEDLALLRKLRKQAIKSDSREELERIVNQFKIQAVNTRNAKSKQ